MKEQPYQAVLGVMGEGEPVTAVAGRFGVSRPTMHAWLARSLVGMAAAPVNA